MNDWYSRTADAPGHIPELALELAVELAEVELSVELVAEVEDEEEVPRSVEVALQMMVVMSVPAYDNPAKSKYVSSKPLICIQVPSVIVGSETETEGLFPHLSPAYPV